MNLEIDSEKVGILVIDFQERLAGAMPEHIFLQAVKNAQNLLHTADEMDIPIVVTEQYPEGLGSTIQGLSEWSETPLSKTHFSGWRDPMIRARIETLNRTQWIVIGMETHICVFQTVRDLMAQDYTVWVPTDAVVAVQSRIGKRDFPDRSTGAQPTCVEAVLFDLLKEGRGETFKAVSRRIRKESNVFLRHDL